MEEGMMQNFKVYYDAEEDILFLGKEGQEQEVREVSPGLNLELDANGALIGVEVFNASRMFKDILKPMENRLQIA
jgi:uncharacterized protein YuzE